MSDRADWEADVETAIDAMENALALVNRVFVSHPAAGRLEVMLMSCFHHTWESVKRMLLNQKDSNE